jgi:hypothetical protein
MIATTLLMCGLVAKGEAPSKPTQAIERGLGFLQKDAAKWQKERHCATCHHGTFTVWVLAEAKRQGYAVPADSVSENVKWCQERLKDIDKPRDTRPGYSMVNSMALNLALMAAMWPEQSALSAKELKRMAGHLLRHQEADGSWSWASAPAQNRPPPFFESDEVATLLGYLALGPFVPKDEREKSEFRDARQKAAMWLAKTPATSTTQAAMLRLLVKVQAGDPQRRLQPDVDRFLARQNKDGGWPQLLNGSSDAYATGQALYALNIAGVKPSQPEVRRGVDFLIKTQNEDGSWPMKRRGHEGVTPGDFTVPIVYFGSAWATLGLVRSVPAMPNRP